MKIDTQMKRNILPFSIIGASLIVRLVLIDSIEFVNPDGATYLRYDLLVYTQRLPFFPMLINTVALLGLDRLLAAKLIASLAAVGAMGVAMKAATEIGLEKQRAWLAALPLAVDPLFILHTVQPLTEGVFVLCAALATWFTLRFSRANKWTDLFGLLFCAGLAAFTRAEGLVFIPVMVWGLIRFMRQKDEWKEIPPILLGLFPWLLIIVWQLGIVGRAGYFAEFGVSVADASVIAVLARGARHLFGIGMHLMVIGLVPLLIGIFHWRILWRMTPMMRRNGMLLIYLLLAGWLGISIHWTFDLRFSTMLVFWLSLPIGLGLRRWLTGGPVRKRMAQAMMMAMFIAGLGLAISLVAGMQRIGWEIQLSAEAVNHQPATLPVLADEQAMTSYHLGRLALPYKRDVPFSRSLVILRDRYTNPDQERLALDAQFEINTLKQIEVEDARGETRRAEVWLISRRVETPVASPSTIEANAPGD